MSYDPVREELGQLKLFADRFLVPVFVGTIEDPQLETLLDSGWSLAAADRVAYLAIIFWSQWMTSFRPRRYLIRFFQRIHLRSQEANCRGRCLKAECQCKKL